jgi:solute:Na+ symporter, SSS family
MSPCGQQHFQFATPGLPFLDRMGLCFLIVSALMIVISLIENKGADAKGIPLERGIFRTSMKFNVAAFAVCAILAVIYTVFW